MSRITEGKVVIFSAPSGAGKSTIIGRLLEKFPRLEFSISCTSRPPRGKEVHGREYYFLSNDEFKARAGAGEFVEWEEVYPGTCYGTLRSEVDRIWEKGSVIVFDVDVKGGVNLKKTFGANALSVFIMPPSVEELRRRARRPGNRLGRNDRKAGGQGRAGDRPCPAVRPGDRERLARRSRCRGRKNRRRIHRIVWKSSRPSCCRDLSTRFTKVI